MFSSVQVSYIVIAACLSQCFLIAAADDATDGTCDAEGGGTCGEQRDLVAYFRNDANEAMEVWWQDVDQRTGAISRFKKVLDLQPGAKHWIGTFPGHQFQWVRPGTTQGVSTVFAFHGMPLSIYSDSSSGSSNEEDETWPLSRRNDNCKNSVKEKHFCRNVANDGGCAQNPGWMSVNCARSCGWCHLRDPKLRCSRRNLNISATPVWKPGDLNRMFTTLPDRVKKHYPFVNITVLSTSPHILLFDNIISDHEIDELIKATGGKFEMSTDQGGVDEDGRQEKVVSSSRTSQNAWCQGDCILNVAVDRVIGRIEEFTTTPRANTETFQVLRYEKGQFYAAHHDSGDDSDLASGPRILTFFLYLSDVEEGGETAFPDLGPLVVPPRKGSAILWPSVRDEAPTRVDWRTRHEARPVKKGIKYAANSWIHLYEYRTPNHWGCTGSFDDHTGDDGGEGDDED